MMLHFLLVPAPDARYGDLTLFYLGRVLRQHHRYDTPQIMSDFLSLIVQDNFADPI